MKLKLMEPLFNLDNSWILSAMSIKHGDLGIPVWKKIVILLILDNRFVYSVYTQ